MIRRFFFGILPIHIINLLTYLLPNVSYTTRLRGLLISPFLKKCGKNFKIASGVTINHPERIVIGDNVYIAHNCWINGTGGLILEDDIQIGPMSVIVTSKHIYENNLVTKKSKKSPVKIESGTWLASHVVVSAGVTIGKGVTIGANSVVTKDIESHSVAVGSPAKVIKKQ